MCEISGRAGLGVGAGVGRADCHDRLTQPRPYQKFDPSDAQTTTTTVVGFLYNIHACFFFFIKND